jgi:gluconolactonase
MADEQSASRAGAGERVILTSGLGLPEGPLLMPDGSWLVTELDVSVGTVTRVDQAGRCTPVAKTGRPNGLALTADGRVWVAESLEPCLMWLGTDGESERVLSEVDGVALLWPNDLCIGPDGDIYMTDSGILVGDFLIDGHPRPDCLDLPVDGRVLRYDPVTGEASFLDRGLKFANGIAFGPDGMLYVNETYTGDIQRYRFEDGAVVGPREFFGNVLDPDHQETALHGPDGMAFSEDGRLWVAVFGQGDITVLNPDGSVERRIKLPGRSPTNVAFGRPGEKLIYVVEDEHGAMEIWPAGVDGLALHS